MENVVEKSKHLEKVVACIISKKLLKKIEVGKMKLGKKIELDTRSCCEVPLSLACSWVQGTGREELTI